MTGNKDVRRLVAIAKPIVQSRSFHDYTELKEALKTAFARLKGIRYDAGMVAEVLDQLERGGRHPLVRVHVVSNIEYVERPADWKAIGRGEASALVQQLRGGRKRPAA